MAGLTSVSGLVSGLDTATIVSQLMQIEAQSQTRIKARLGTAQTTLKSLQDLNSKLAALATGAGDLSKATAWNPVKVTSSSTLVTATAGADAVAGPLTLTVGQTALAHRLTFSNTAALADPVTTGSTHVLLDPHEPVDPSNPLGPTKPPLDLDTGDGSLRGLINALNATGTGVKASTVNVNGSYRLQVTSTTTGLASEFTLKNVDGSDILGGTTVRDGQDAEITVGPDQLTSATNTFANIANGLTITLGATVPSNTVVDLDVQQDVAGMTKTVKGIVDAVNDALSKIDSLTAYNSSTKTPGPLAGDSAVRAVRAQLLNTVYTTDGSSLAAVGVQLDRYGKLTFDEAKFNQAYAADPAGVAAKFTSGTTDGFAARVQKVANAASDGATGTIATAINGRSSEIKRMQDSVADWDSRLALRQQTLQRQFTALETALSQMNSQSSWLSGQLASLSKGS